MPLILRSVKGSKLTISEMDGNLTYLSSTLSGSVIQVTGSSISAPNTSITASSFVGNGSQLTNINFPTGSLVTTSSFNSYTVSINNFTASYNTGSFSGSFTGSLIGTSSQAISSSFALTASHLLNAPSFDTSSLATTGSNIFIGDQTITGSIFIGGGSITPDDDVVTLGDDGNRFRGATISRTLIVGDPTGVNTKISTFARDGEEFVGTITLSTGSGAPEVAGTEGMMFLTQRSGGYYIYVYIGGTWRSSSLA